MKAFGDDDGLWIDQLTLPRPLALLLALFVILCVVAVTGALAEEPKGVMFDCGKLGEAIEDLAGLRDIGADVEKTVSLVLARNSASPRPRLEVLVREIRRMWSERLPPAEAGFAVYRRCQAQLGDMGRES